MLKAVFDWFRSPSPKAFAPAVQPEAAPYKVEAPVVALVAEAAPTHTTAAAKKPAVKKTQTSKKPAAAITAAKKPAVKKSAAKKPT